MLVVGLTGGIACGKSTVSTEFAISGIPIVDADVIARQVVEPGRKTYTEVVEAFKEEVPDLVNDDLLLNRPALGRAVFGKPDKLKILNLLVHGAVKKEMILQVAKAYIGGHKVVVLDVPLLFELGIFRVCGKVVNVDADRETQVARILRRNAELTEDDARKRIASQMLLAERNSRADIVIRNTGTLDSLKDTTRHVIGQIQPHWVWYYLDLFPPFAAASAVYTVLVRFALAFFQSKHKQD